MSDDRISDIESGCAIPNSNDRSAALGPRKRFAFKTLFVLFHAGSSLYPVHIFATNTLFIFTRVVL